MSILDLNADAALAARPRFVEQPKPQPKTSIWQDAAALATAIPRGVGEGVAQVGATMAEIMAGYGDTMARMESGQSLQDRAPNMQSDFADSLRDRGREFRPDAQSATAAEQVLFGFARGATKIVGGAVAGGAPGVVLAGVEEGYTQRGELIAEGVDPTTARKAGAVQGAGLALAALPVAGQTLRATAALYLAGGPGGFMAQQALTREILQRGGYDERAAATDPFDPVGLAVSALVPAPFAVMGLRSARLRADLTREIGAQAYMAPRAPDMTPTAQAVRAAFPREVEDAARVLADVQQRAAANPRPPSDLPAAAAHETALARAEAALAAGERVEVGDAVPVSLSRAEYEANLTRFMEGSKVVDEQGAPLVVYHGTGADIAAFDPARSRDAGVWMTPVPGAAEMYSGARDGANLIPAYVALRNPYEATVGDSRADALMRAADGGHDGVIIRDTDGSISTLAAFSPNQIKSAVGNTGRFDPTSPSLTDSPFDDWAQQITTAIRELQTSRQMDAPQDVAPAAAQTDATIQAARTAAQDLADSGKPLEQFIGEGNLAPEVRNLLVGMTENPGRADAMLGDFARTRQARPSAPAMDVAADVVEAARRGEAVTPEAPIKAGDATSVEAQTLPPRIAEVQAQFPDLMVQMDGMDKPVPAAELLRVVRDQAARDQQDGELLAAAAQCAIVNGF